MLPVLIVVALAAAILVFALLMVARRRRKRNDANANPEDEIRASLTEDTSDGSPDSDSDERDPVTIAATASADPWGSPGRDRGGDPDPAGPPAAIHIEVSGAHPWSPVGLFLTELGEEGYETTVELPDLVVMRDVDRAPVTVREPSGPPGHLIVTSAPESLAATLETLVRSLLADSFVVQATDGRDVRLVDNDGTEILLSVTELALH